MNTAARMACLAMALVSPWHVSLANDQTSRKAPTACVTEIRDLPTRRAALPQLSLARPALDGTAVDPAHGTCIQRLTDHLDSSSGDFLRTIYSRSEAFNADDSRVLVFDDNGYWHLIDPLDSRDLGRLPALAGDAEPQWHRVDPDLLYYLPAFGGMQVRELDVASGRSRMVADFRGRLPWPNAARVWTRAEGSPSADQRWWGFLVETEQFQPLGMIVWDALNDAIVGTLDFAQAGLDRPDHVSMTPSGRYITGSWAAPTGTIAWNRDFTQKVRLSSNTEHSDIALLPDGHDAFVSIDFQSNNGDVYYVDITSSMSAGQRQRVDLFPTYDSGLAVSFHFSGKAFDRPGWVLASTYSPTGTPLRWMDERIFAIELKPNGRTIHLAHTRTTVNGEYWTEPHASVNRDFTKVVFNSNWRNTSNLDVDTYLISGLHWDGDSPGDSPCNESSGALERPLPNRTWALLSLPCEPPAGTGVAALFGDDLPGELGTDWALYSFDPSVNDYRAANASTQLVPGQGFWIIQLSGSNRTLSLPSGSAAAATTAPNTQCRSGIGCRDIALSGLTTPSPWNLIGQPFDTPTTWPQWRISASTGTCSDGDGCSPNDARAARIIDVNAWRYNDTSEPPRYENLDAGNAIQPWDGFWVVQLPSASGNAPTLHAPR